MMMRVYLQRGLKNDLRQSGEYAGLQLSDLAHGMRSPSVTGTLPPFSFSTLNVRKENGGNVP